MPERVQRKRTKGYKMPPNTKSVTRPGKWGNHLKVGDEVNGIVLKTVGMVVEAHRRWLRDTPEGRALAIEAQKELRGYNLACFCPLDQPCHADNVLEVANI